VSEPERIRTFDRCLRRAMLYPAELLVHVLIYLVKSKYKKIKNIPIIEKLAPIYDALT
tara:strand:- start:186 stop:359 length:174 start_codon:yes stop_codon:yes gene_type:complete